MSLFNSKFSTNWYDKSNYIHSNEYQNISVEWRENVSQYINDGYTIIKNAIPIVDIDKYIDNVYNKALRKKAILSRGSDYFDISSLDELSVPLTKLLDTHAFCIESLKLIFANKITSFIDCLWQVKPFCFQTLHFEKGSTQAIHQDTAYVVVDNPLNLCAAWIALEDVQEGSGELVYFPGSHRFEDFLYNNQTSKHWDTNIDDSSLHDHHLHWLNEEATRRNINKSKFLPQKGDVLIWHADLAHGGNIIDDTSLTRKSLVAHYTKPINEPNYFKGISFERRLKLEYPNGLISSYFYNFHEC
jgi:phytanoyl-CoA hydroxylase